MAAERVAADLGGELVLYAERTHTARIRAEGRPVPELVAEARYHPLTTYAGPNHVVRATALHPVYSATQGFKVKNLDAHLRFDGQRLVLMPGEFDEATLALIAAANAAQAQVPVRIEVYQTAVDNYAAAAAAVSAAEDWLDLTKSDLSALESAVDHAVSMVESTQKSLKDIVDDTASAQSTADKKKGEWLDQEEKALSAEAAHAVAQADPETSDGELASFAKTAAEERAKATEKLTTYSAKQTIADDFAAFIPSAEQAVADAQAALGPATAAASAAEAARDDAVAVLASSMASKESAKQARDAAKSARSAAVSLANSTTSAAQHAIDDFEDDYDGYAAVFEKLKWDIDQLGVAAAVSHGLSGQGVTIAVLDTGVAYEEHTDSSGSYFVAPDLAHVDFVAPYDFLNGDAHANDDNGHGTQMTTLMAGLGLTFSVAPNVTIMPIRVLDGQRVGTEDALIAGISWATANGADVINMSLAFPDGYVPSPGLEQDPVFDGVLAPLREWGQVMEIQPGGLFARSSRLATRTVCFWFLGA